MHMTRRAPELSATSRLVCIWIMVSNLPELLAGGQGGLWQDLPGLQLRLRSALDDSSDLSGLENVALVVGVVALGATDGLLQQRMQNGPLDLDHDRLVALVGNDHALENSFWHS